MKKQMRQLVYNAVKCLLCEDIIESWHRHCYVTCSCGAAAVDGGLDYQRGMGSSIENLSVYLDEPFEKVRQYAFRVSRGINLDEEPHPIRLKDMNNAWLEAAIAYELEHKSSAPWHLQLLIREKQERNIHEV